MMTKFAFYGELKSRYVIYSFKTKMLRQKNPYIINNFNNQNTALEYNFYLTTFQNQFQQF